jgi:hypothetical protein
MQQVSMPTNEAGVNCSTAASIREAGVVAASSELVTFHPAHGVPPDRGLASLLE